MSPSSDTGSLRRPDPAQPGAAVMSRQVQLLAIVVAGVTLACGGTDDGAGVTDAAAADVATDISSFDSAGDDASDAAGGDVTADADPDGASTDASDDATGDTASPDAGLGGALCDDAGDCPTGYDCVRPDVEAPAGLCTTRCLEDADCGDGFACFLITSSVGDAERWCLPTELCIDEDGDGFGFGSDCRGRDCDDANSRINPAADEVCDGLDNDCDDRVDDNPIEDNDPCTTGLAGRCSPGRYLCDGGVLFCEAEAGGEPEVCDGLDNDCDGEMDEGDVCGDTCCVDDNCNGACAFGTLSEGGVCEPPRSVGAEVCDGIDNDCDGETDESDPALDAACDSPEPGLCTPGVTSCVEGALICLSTVDPRAEVCNGEDDDCNGEVDDGGVCAGEPCCYLDDCDGVCGTATTDEGGACIEPGAYGEETCDGVDNDCDGRVDEGGVCAGEPCCYGDDCDGVCGTARTDDRGECVEPASFGSDVCDGLDNDCDGDVDDADPAIGDACNTGLLGVCAAGIRSCVDGALQCDATTALSAEVCNGLDDDCDGTVDDGVTSTWYRDADRDGAGAASGGVREACSAPAGYVANDTDCNDGDPAIRPGAREVVGDNVDQDCDGSELCYVDRDRDGVRTGDLVSSMDTDCRDPGESEATDTVLDCNDGDPTIRPGAPEGAGDGVDQNCDRREVCFGDADRDGYHDDTPDVISLDLDCTDPGEAGSRVPGGDCNDGNPFINPGARELCNGIDDDCDGPADEGLPVGTWYPDEDDDDYGDEGAGIETCEPPPGYITTGGDCDDENPSINPGVAFDFCDAVDNDCDRRVDEDAPDFEVGCCCEDRFCRQGVRLSDVVRVCDRGTYRCDYRGETTIVPLCELIP